MFSLIFCEPKACILNTYAVLGFLVAQTVNHPLAMQETRVPFLGQEDPLENEIETTPVLLPGKFHGWSSLVGYSPRGCKESDMTERFHFHFSFML